MKWKKRKRRNAKYSKNWEGQKFWEGLAREGGSRKGSGRQRASSPHPSWPNPTETGREMLQLPIFSHPQPFPAAEDMHTLNAASSVSARTFGLGKANSEVPVKKQQQPHRGICCQAGRAMGSKEVLIVWRILVWRITFWSEKTFKSHLAQVHHHT